jgi:hypothetical protein
MAYEFTEFEHEPETQSSAAYGGKPPGKRTAAGVLEPPVPPKRPPGPIPTIPASQIFRILAALLLAVMGVLTLLALFRSF